MLSWLFGSRSQDEKVNFNVQDTRSVDGHCFIAGNVTIQGDVSFAGTLRIDGRIDGKVQVYEGKKGTVIVSKGAVVNGPIYATDLITDGAIFGEVIVENRVECRANAVLKGEVQYKTISISDGARIEGKCLQYTNRAGAALAALKSSAMGTRPLLTDGRENVEADAKVVDMTFLKKNK